MSRGRAWWTGCVVAALVAAGCTSGDDEADGSDDSTTTAPAAEVAEVDPVVCADGEGTACLLPWPNDGLTVADDTTATGRRLDLPDEALPVNADGTPVDVTDQERADGFSPVSTILLAAPAVDLEASRLPPSTDIGASLADDAGIALVDTTTGDRWPYWAELDAQAAGEAGDEPLLMLRPAVALAEGHTYEVAVGDLVTAAGDPVEVDVPDPWRFTVASADSLSGRLRSMVAEAGATTPGFTVTDVEAGDPTVVRGTFVLPNFLDNDGSTGGRFVLDDDGLPTLSTATPDVDARFTCIVGGAEPRPTAVYGHGLLGSQEEVLGLGSIVTLGGLNTCATDWIGMAADDLPTIGGILEDASGFPAVADRLQQGQLAFHLLGRLVNDPDGFAADPAFATPDGTPRLAPDGAVFVGLSQGGILGGAVSAVTDQWSRAVLGVPGMGYNTLLTRSSNWPRFQEPFEAAYPAATDRALVLELLQLLWDRGENAGYAQHLGDDPYPGATATDVYMVAAIGDHQVANVSTEVLARTIGARAAPADPRSDAVEPLWGIDRVDGFPAGPPYLSVWDFGTPLPPPDNRAPTEPEHGSDPHGAGSEEIGVLTQALTFLTSGEVVDPCDGGPCQGTPPD